MISYKAYKYTVLRAGAKSMFNYPYSHLVGGTKLSYWLDRWLKGQIIIFRLFFATCNETTQTIHKNLTHNLHTSKNGETNLRNKKPITRKSRRVYHNQTHRP